MPGTGSVTAAPCQRAVPSPVTRGARFAGLDQARAVAVLAMLSAHFAPGLFAHVPALEPVRVPVLWFSRLATPTFVVVFGLTVGFISLPRYAAEPGRRMRRLLQRAGVMLLCAVVITLPLWTRLAATNATDPWPWLFGLYSVLLFYALALALLPLWLRWLTPRPAPRAIAAGAGLWAVGTAGHILWAQGPPSLTEFARMVLVSGNYAYLQMMGTALIALPVGHWLRRASGRPQDRPALACALVGGLALAGLGGLWGWAVGDYDPGRILSGELRTPPRAWYFLHFGGVGLALVPALELLTRTIRPLRPGWYVLALFGQVGLVLYTGHAFVLPALAVTDRWASVYGAWRAAAALTPFALFCGAVLYARHRHLSRQPDEGPGAGLGDTCHSQPLKRRPSHPGSGGLRGGPRTDPPPG